MNFLLLQLCLQLQVTTTFQQTSLLRSGNQKFFFGHFLFYAFFSISDDAVNHYIVDVAMCIRLWLFSEIFVVVFCYFFFEFFGDGAHKFVMPSSLLMSVTATAGIKTAEKRAGQFACLEIFFFLLLFEFYTASKTLIRVQISIVEIDYDYG